MCRQRVRVAVARAQPEVVSIDVVHACKPSCTERGDRERRQAEHQAEPCTIKERSGASGPCAQPHRYDRRAAALRSSGRVRPNWLSHCGSPARQTGQSMPRLGRCPEVRQTDRDTPPGMHSFVRTEISVCRFAGAFSPSVSTVSIINARGRMETTSPGGDIRRRPSGSWACSSRMRWDLHRFCVQTRYG
jgi:hypothetical protein